MYLKLHYFTDEAKIRYGWLAWFPPSRKRPLPLSQKNSNVERDEDRIISASETAWGFNGRPNTGAIVVLKTESSSSKATSNPRKGTFTCRTR
ncbi:hypothetical protein V6N13_096192 [Hibiscus sabdariffa]